MTRALWASGPFADAYLERNIEAGSLRAPFWRGILDRHPINSVLEVGCSVGANLRWITDLVDTAWGVDVNEKALAIMEQRIPSAYSQVASALALPFAAGTFDLSFCAGLLIHLNDAELPKAMDELVRVSSRFVLTIEYRSPITEDIPYRGTRGTLWKRPYAELFKARFTSLRKVEDGFLGRDAGWDVCDFDLWEKV